MSAKGELVHVPPEGEAAGGFNVTCRTEGCGTESFVGGIPEREDVTKALFTVGWDMEVTKDGERWLCPDESFHS